MKHPVKGVSLIELLLTLFLLSLTMAAVLRAFVAGLSAEKRIATARDTSEESIRLEEGISSLIAGSDLTDGESEFISPVPRNNLSSQTQPSGGGLPPGSSSLSFTTWSKPPPTRYFGQGQRPWEALNSQFGPQGGTTQFALALDPVGDAGLKQGLFIREQKPPQQDISVGGTERLYSSQVADIRFEFYDGTAWQTSWDSRNGQKGKLPAAVRVTYLLRNEQTPHSFLVRIAAPAPASPQGAGS